MSRYRFVPSELGKDAFNLAAPEYVGEEMTPLLESVLGEKDWEEYMIVQDPLGSGKASGEVNVIPVFAAGSSKHPASRSIGTIYKLD